MVRKTYRRKYSRKSSHAKKSRFTRKARKYTRKARKYTRKDVIGKGNRDNPVNCCICENEITNSEILSPSECVLKYGKRSHRICEDCWFNENEYGPNGFSTEGISHKCPGCEKKLPLTKVPNAEAVIIDLTDD